MTGVFISDKINKKILENAWIVFDTGENTIDRYTAIDIRNGDTLTLSEDPDHWQKGFCQFGGNCIEFHELTEYQKRDAFNNDSKRDKCMHEFIGRMVVDKEANILSVTEIPLKVQYKLKEYLKGEVKDEICSKIQ